VKEFVIRPLVDGSPLAARLQNQAALPDESDCPRAVSIRFVLRFIPSLTQMPRFTTLLPRLNSSIAENFSDPIERRHQSSDWLFWNPIGEGRDNQRFSTTSS